MMLKKQESAEQMKARYFSNFKNDLGSKEDIKKIVNESVGLDEETLPILMCNICQQTVVDPKECSNGCTSGMWCNDCIVMYFAINPHQNGQCPSCRQPCEVRTPNPRTMFFLNQQVVKCMQKDCPEQGKLQSYEDLVRNHIKICIKKTCSCVICGFQDLKVEDINTHYEVCPKMVENCFYCDLPIQRRKFEHHIQN